MQSVYENILTILTSPAGILTYQLILVFAIAWAFQGAISLLQSNRLPSFRRLVLGLGLLLVSRVGLFIVGVLVTTGVITNSDLLPILDRAVNAFSMIIIVWLWAFPEAMRLADAASILLSLLVVTLLALSLTWSSAQFRGVPLNDTVLNTLWEGFSLLIALGGMLLLLLRRPPAWEYGLGMLVILFLGHLVQLFFPIPGESIPGAVRLAQLAAYPFLLALPQRYYGGVTFHEIGQKPKVGRIENEVLPAVLNWFAIDQFEEEVHILKSLPQYLPTLFKVDLAAVLLPPGGEGEPELTVYFPEADQTQEGIFISEEKIPILWNALQRERPLRLHASSSSADLDVLCEALSIKTANLLAIPIVYQKKARNPGMLLFTLQPGEAWSSAEQDSAVQFAEGLANQLQQKTLARTPSIGDHSIEPTEELSKLKHAELLEVAAKLQAENEALLAELDTWQHESPDEQVHLLESELRQTLAELALLQQQLSEVDQKALEAGTGPLGNHEQMEVILSIAQDLRQPMSSILGYTDLLLGESVGILGALQRKFLERIRASTERMGSSIEDLVHVATLESGEITLQPVEVDLNSVIDEAIAHTSARMIEKNIALRVDIPEDLPSIQADQDALQQVVIHLLQNAGAASPTDGEIQIVVQSAPDELQSRDYVLLQVRDTGGGIPNEDLPRVFSRLYRADNPLIQGVGDTGVGLSVAKNLVEALHGRIWVDTEMGAGSTFSVLLPVSANGNYAGEDWLSP